MKKFKVLDSSISSTFLILTALYTYFASQVLKAIRILKEISVIVKVKRIN